MTLVVAHVYPELAFMVADTILEAQTNEKQGFANGQTHTLKVQILSATIVVAFAGHADTARDVIFHTDQALKADPSIDVASTIHDAYLERLHAASQYLEIDCEFLVMEMPASGKTTLRHVTAGDILPCERAYIGEQDAYRRLCEIQNDLDIEMPAVVTVQQSDGSFKDIPYVPPRGEPEFIRLGTAMESLCAEKRFSSVGAMPNCIARVINARISGGFEYLQNGIVGVSAEEGQFGFTYLASNEGRRGVGVYFRSGKVGFFFIAGASEWGYREDADNLSSFIAVARDKYGLNLTGATWD